MYQPNKYLNNEELESLLIHFSEKYSHLCDLEVLNKTQDGNSIYLMSIYDKSGKPHNERPAYWVDGGTHCTEISSTQACMHLMHLLLENPEQDDYILDLLKSFTVYILPRITPDGVAHVFKNKEYIRSSKKSYPQNDLVEGFENKDLDGNNELLFMRKLDPQGRWKVSKKDPRIMVPRGLTENDPNEKYYFLFREGEFKNFDGFHQKGLINQGLDFNRNYPASWRAEEVTKGAGKYPLSEIETRTVVEAMSSRENIIIAQSFHTFSGVTLRPSSTHPDSTLAPSDLFIYKELGEINKQVSGYDCISIYHDFKYQSGNEVTGSFLEWAYYQMGYFAFTTELWNIRDLVGLEKNYIPDLYRHYNEDEFLKIIKKFEDDEIIDDLYIEWKSYKHSQLGEVEIGGWKPLKFMSNPHEKYLEELVHKNAKVVIEHTKTYPRVVVKECEARKVEGDISRVSIILENQGALPTYGSEISKKSAYLNKPKLTIETDLELISDKKEYEFDHLEGRTQNNMMSNYLFPIIDLNSHQRKFDVLVKGSGSVRLVFDIGKAGRVCYLVEVQ